MEEEKEATRSRSFRDEDYVTRRVFLRSYPLQWEEKPSTDIAESLTESEESDVGKLSLKCKLIAAFQWGEGKVLMLRKLKHKIAFVFVSCQPFRFKSSNNLLTM